MASESEQLLRQLRGGSGGGGGGYSGGYSGGGGSWGSSSSSSSSYGYGSSSSGEAMSTDGFIAIAVVIGKWFHANHRIVISLCRRNK